MSLLKLSSESQAQRRDSLDRPGGRSLRRGVVVLAPAVDNHPCPPTPPRGAWTTRPVAGPGGGCPPLPEADAPTVDSLELPTVGLPYYFLKQAQGYGNPRPGQTPGAPVLFSSERGGSATRSGACPEGQVGRGERVGSAAQTPSSLVTLPRERRGVGAKAPPPDRERAALPV